MDHGLDIKDALEDVTNAPNPRFDVSRAGFYDARIQKTIPGYQTLHDLTAVALGAELPEDAKLLIVGAGTGHEIVTLGAQHSKWTFTAIDPSEPMLTIARQRTQEAGMSDRVQWIQGTVDEVELEGDFDAATMLLALHFVPRAEKSNHLAAIRRHLRPGAPFILADSFGDPETTRFKRYLHLMKEWGRAHGLDESYLAELYDPTRKDLHRVPEDVIKALLRDAGFIDIQRLFQAYFIGAWLARAPR